MLAPTPGIASSQNLRVPSQNTHPPIPLYFIYCGEFCIFSVSCITFDVSWAFQLWRSRTVLELCVCCLLVMPIRFAWTPSGPCFRIRTTLWNKSLIGWVYTNPYILVWTVLCLPVACLFYYLTVRLGFSNFFAILCAQHIILNSWLSLCLRLPYFIRMLGAHDSLQFDSRLGVCWRLLNFIRTSWAHNIS